MKQESVSFDDARFSSIPGIVCGIAFNSDFAGNFIMNLTKQKLGLW